MKRSLIAVSLLIVGVCHAGQDSMIQPLPKELKQASFLLGTWRLNLTFSFGGQATKGGGTATCEMGVGGRYFVQKHVYTMAGQTEKVHGLHLLSYDPMKKRWFGSWFDSAAAGDMRMTGSLTGNTLQLVGEPTEMPGAPEPMVMRSTWVKKSARSIDFKLEMKTGESWSPMIVGTYTKIGR